MGVDVDHAWQSLHFHRLTISSDAPHPLPENSQRRRLQEAEDASDRRRGTRTTAGSRGVNLWTNGVVPYVIEAAVGQTYDAQGAEGSEVTTERIGAHDYL